LLAVSLLTLLAGCSAQSTYDRVPTTGRFSGEPRMVALAPNTFFFSQPEDGEKFSFTTHKRGDPRLEVKGGRGQYRWSEFRIEPEEMITNGASIPRNLWYVPGFAPFDFTRAAVIHDWLFEAHHRFIMARAAFVAAQTHHDTKAMKRSSDDIKAYKRYGDLSQEDAADIFAECIKVAMVQSEEINEALKRFPRSVDPEHPSPEAFKELKASLRYNQKPADALGIPLFCQSGRLHQDEQEALGRKALHHRNLSLSNQSRREGGCVAKGISFPLVDEKICGNPRTRRGSA
jgi:hypothetical protein